MLYSDGTIGGLRAIEFLGEIIQRRLQKCLFIKEYQRFNEVTKEVEALLQKYVFVELHGNAAPDLPNRSRIFIGQTKKIK